MTVLVVDDEPTTRAMLRRVLVRDCSCAVVEAADGLAAMAALDEQAFGLVITDLGMPELTGLELLEAIRGYPRLAALPVVIMSAERSEDTVRAAIALGIQGYLGKPIAARSLKSKLQPLVQAAAARDHSSARPDALHVNGPFFIVDGDVDFRQMFASAFSTMRPVVQTATGVEALVEAANVQPAAIFIGSDTGGLGGDLLIRKLRTHPNLQQTKVVVIQSRHSSERLPGAHATIVRSFGAESLRIQVESILMPSPPPPPPAGGSPVAPDAPLPQLASACEPNLGPTLGRNVE